MWKIFVKRNNNGRVYKVKKNITVIILNIKNVYRVSVKDRGRLHYKLSPIRPNKRIWKCVCVVCVWKTEQLHNDSAQLCHTVQQRRCQKEETEGSCTTAPHPAVQETVTSTNYEEKPKNRSITARGKPFEINHYLHHQTVVEMKRA